MLLGILILLTLFPSCFLKEKINQKAATRHAIEECEKIDYETVAGSGDLAHSVGEAIISSKVYQQGYIKIAISNGPIVLDAWSNQLQVITAEHLKRMTGVSPALLGKTNKIIIWSIGPNGSNEWGNGDDVFIKTSN